jgi:hypothetical protein
VRQFLSHKFGNVSLGTSVWGRQFGDVNVFGCQFSTASISGRQYLRCPFGDVNIGDVSLGSLVLDASILETSFWVPQF